MVCACTSTLYSLGVVPYIYPNTADSVTVTGDEFRECFEKYSCSAMENVRGVRFLEDDASLRFLPCSPRLKLSIALSRSLHRALSHLTDP